jgi:hypothetical protein
VWFCLLVFFTADVQVNVKVVDDRGVCKDPAHAIPFSPKTEVSQLRDLILNNSTAFGTDCNVNDLRILDANNPDLKTHSSLAIYKMLQDTDVAITVTVTVTGNGFKDILLKPQLHFLQFSSTSSGASVHLRNIEMFSKCVNHEICILSSRPLNPIT